MRVISYTIRISKKKNSPHFDFAKKKKKNLLRSHRNCKMTDNERSSWKRRRERRRNLGPNSNEQDQILSIIVAKKKKILQIPEQGKINSVVTATHWEISARRSKFGQNSSPDSTKKMFSMRRTCDFAFNFEKKKENSSSS